MDRLRASSLGRENAKAVPSGDWESAPMSEIQKIQFEMLSAQFPQPKNIARFKLTALPQLVLLLPPPGQSLGALLQRLDEDSLWHLQSGGVSLPQLQVQLREYVAEHRRIPGIRIKIYIIFNFVPICGKLLHVCSFPSKVEFLQVRIALDEDLGLNGEDFFHVGADHAGESHLADLLQLVWKRNGEKRHKERRKSGQAIVITSYHHHERELVARIGMRPPLRQ